MRAGQGEFSLSPPSMCVCLSLSLSLSLFVMFDVYGHVLIRVCLLVLFLIGLLLCWWFGEEEGGWLVVLKS